MEVYLLFFLPSESELTLHEVPLPKNANFEKGAKNCFEYPMKNLMAYRKNRHMCHDGGAPLFLLILPLNSGA